MISIYFGSPGCGKTAYLQRLAYKNHKKREVYANVALAYTSFFDISQFGKVSFPEGSLILIDEAGICYNNRKYKSLSLDVIEYLKLHRHYKVDIVVVSQSYEDMDITFRRLADQFFHIKRIRNCSLVRPIHKFVTVDKESEQIIDGYRLGSIFGFRFFWLPRWWWLYKSYEIDNRPVVSSRPSLVPSSRPFSSRAIGWIYCAVFVLAVAVLLLLLP